MKILEQLDDLNLDAAAKTQVTALTQALLGTAKLNGIDPSAWLSDTLEKLPTWPNSRIDELLPFAQSADDVKPQGNNEG
jgi:hypothetical protein